MNARSMIRSPWRLGAPSAPRPDFLRPTRGVPALGWAAVGVSLLVLGLAAGDAWQARQGLQAARAERDRIGAALSDLTRQAASGTGRDAPTASARVRPAVPDEAASALREARSRLDRPWPDIFGSVESIAVPGVAWLALDAADNGSLRLEGSVPDAGAALLAADRLRRSPVWRDVTVGRMASAGSAGGGLRIEITALPAAGSP